MFRKIALSFVAAATLVAFAPGVASAGFKQGGGHFGKHHGGGGFHKFRHFGGTGVRIVTTSCWQEKIVKTHFGFKRVLVDVCGY